MPQILSPYLSHPTKRVFDLSVSLLLIILLLPLFLAIFLLVLITSGTPVFFRQKRTGIRARSFTLIKFRTMIKGAPQQRWRHQHLNQAEPPLFKIHRDPRFTRLGFLLSHTGLDELPQLFNIVSGHMSLIGPRPLEPGHSKKLPPKARARFSVRPGLISPAIRTRPLPSLDKRFQSELHYLQTASLRLDALFLFLGIKRSLQVFFSLLTHRHQRP